MQALPLLVEHKYGSPVLRIESSITYHPCYPERSSGLSSLSRPTGGGLPLLTTGSAPLKWITRLHIGSLSLRSVILPLENLQPLITQTLLSGAMKMYE